MAASLKQHNQLQVPILAARKSQKGKNCVLAEWNCMKVCDVLEMVSVARLN
jgi:hypothetical protein